MRYLLDTNVCIRVLNGSSPSVVDHLRALDPMDVAISAVVRAELVYGAHKSRHVEENLRLVESFCEPLATLAFESTCADIYGRIRSYLESHGRPIGPNDLLISATALAHSLTVVTHNRSEFARVPGLRVADWEEPETPDL